jgi:hypothetical protein
MEPQIDTGDAEAGARTGVTKADGHTGRALAWGSIVPRRRSGCLYSHSYIYIKAHAARSTTIGYVRLYLWLPLWLLYGYSLTPRLRSRTAA